MSRARFVASFAYYGSVLSSSELLEKNLLCVTNADRDHQIKHRHQDGLCYCIPFTLSDYQTLLISCLGEVACKSEISLREPARRDQEVLSSPSSGSLHSFKPLTLCPSDPFKHRSTERVWAEDDPDRAAAAGSRLLYDTQHLHHYVRTPPTSLTALV